MKLYESLGRELLALIEGGTLRPGDRVPSVRQLCRERRVSPATVMRAYQWLEARGAIESRPRSGYYVSGRAMSSMPATTRARAGSTRVEVNDLVFEILDGARNRDVVPLGSAFPGPTLFPWARLARHLGSSARHLDPWSTVDTLPPGSPELRRQIARRYLRHGMTVTADEIVITAGALEGLNLALQVLTRPGDTIAIEAPAFYACLQSVEAHGLKAVEIPVRGRDGLDLAALARAIERHDIRACWFMPTFQNPTGALMPDERKRELVELLTRHRIPLIEDDVYAELHYGAERPHPAKAFDTHGLVVSCGSFSKCLAPGYRLGWVAAGRFAEQIKRRKIVSSLSTSLPIQHCVSQLLREDSYDAHLAKLRRALAAQQGAMLAALRRHLPPGSRVSEPQGGYMLWVELPDGTDSLEVHRRALERGISVAPGPMFSARREYRDFVRLNCGHPWTAGTERAIADLGRIVADVGAGVRA